MNSVTAHSPFDLRMPGSEVVQQIVDELWQKGYDLKKAGMGWVVREPLGAGKIELESDAALIEFAGCGGTIRELRTHSFEAIGLPPPAQPPMAAKLAVPAPDRQSPPPQMPLHEAEQVEPISLRRLGADIWNEVLPPQLRRRLLVGLALLFALIGLAETWRWLAPANAAGPAIIPPVQEKPTPSMETPAEFPRKLENSPQALLVASNAARLLPAAKPLAVLDTLPTVAEKRRNPLDLTVFADQCALRLVDKFALGTLALMVNEQGRSVANCFALDGKMHCPHVSNGRATLHYLDTHSKPAAVYACDIDISSNAIGNLRLVDANPDIVRFLAADGNGRP